MLKSKEILELLKGCPQGFLKPDHIIFKESNINLLQTFKKQGAITSRDFFEDSLNNSSSQIFCNVFSCSAVFDDVSSYQSHYNVMHRFICSQCKKSLPTEHFLDLHISEHHDSYFEARRDRGERLFKCFLEECTEVLKNPHERKEHCIKDHKFPSNFRFDHVIHKDKTLGDIKCKKGLKPFSFGHQKGKSFLSENDLKQKRNTEKSLEDMNALKQALESV